MPHKATLSFSFCSAVKNSCNTDWPLATFPNVRSNFSIICSVVGSEPSITIFFLASPFREFRNICFTAYSGIAGDFLRLSISTFHSSKVLSFFGTGSAPEKKLMYGLTNGDISFCVLAEVLSSFCFGAVLLRSFICLSPSLDGTLLSGSTSFPEFKFSWALISSSFCSNSFWNFLKYSSRLFNSCSFKACSSKIRSFISAACLSLSSLCWSSWGWNSLLICCLSIAVSSLNFLSLAGISSCLCWVSGSSWFSHCCLLSGSISLSL